ncbi:MAG TPA: ribosomal protein L7/L12 [Longimicrobium sp.]|nr:ribosomal protein L7/L12 [Longimicrobium sp.]
MPAPLRCPTCSAPLDIPPAHADTLRCTYCGAGVLLTERSGQMQAAASHPQHAIAIGEVLQHLRAGDRIGAIRVYREHFGLGLKEAKDAVERLEASRSADMLNRHLEDAASQSPQGEAMTAVLGKLRAGNKIAAIKVYREQFGVGLK